MLGVLVKAPFLVYEQPTSLPIFILERERASSLPLLIRTVIPSWNLHWHDLIISQRPHLQIPPHWGLGFQDRNLEEAQLSPYKDFEQRTVE